MKVDKSILIPAGIAVAAIGIYFLTKPKKEEQAFEQTNQGTTTPVATNGGTPPSNGTTTPTVTINKNKLLKKGVNGAESKELQKLLGVTADGIFGAQTEGALVAKKGVTQTTLNQYGTLPNINQAPIAVGSSVMVNIREGLIPKWATKMADGSFSMSDKNYYKTFKYGDEIGKIVSQTPSKNYYVVEIEFFLAPNEYVFVSAANVKKI
ncbi:hypothetical protein FLJC2902T_17620 [Flavobacterium limnosediminis JC2902]|uniref:Peptidoglycan binding-like domain-containing protein n=1 Tax=Flavobacterium limnosediminis JC2902 TaxID=1341181 RepID=V6SNX8_9FLAO|nr:hypothetical protein [Flavobacterium limnosediminis]ESU28403.1 hypothetical protein FLJC2902T_17620 [Flavobacterium limnosediminis JC2902]